MANMLFFRTSSIFRNRWIAVFWAAGIVFTAVQIAGFEEKPDSKGASHAAARPASADPIQSEEVRKVQSLLKELEKKR